MIIVPDDVLKEESHLELEPQWLLINISFLLIGSPSRPHLHVWGAWVWEGVLSAVLEMIIVPDDVLEKEIYLELEPQWLLINISFLLPGSPPWPHLRVWGARVWEGVLLPAVLETIIIPDYVLEKESHLELKAQWSLINISFL